MKSLATFALTFFGYIISVLANVNYFIPQINWRFVDENHAPFQGVDETRGCFVRTGQGRGTVIPDKTSRFGNLFIHHCINNFG